MGRTINWGLIHYNIWRADACFSKSLQIIKNLIESFTADLQALFIDYYIIVKYSSKIFKITAIIFTFTVP